ncbi:GntR family transcriptional regulator [Planosporangium sp. 12N6]|uniref:GntR family transcriptional regulator n=1 Tax=Planosporangium spinosum TaxID=3402278 RepID=UPI003CEE4226
MPTPHRERPRYRQVAEELRRRILAGAIPAGQLLPSEPVLINEFGVSRGTLREALALLRAEGLVVTEHGRGTYARPARPVRRLASDRYRREVQQLTGEHPPQTSFTHDQGIDWEKYQLDKEFREVPASASVAALFDLPAGTMILERRFLFRAHGVPQQLSTSCYPLDLVAGTPVADPENEPWPGGNTAQLHSLGVTVTGIRERVRARMPTPEESAALRLAAGVPVIAITRRTYAGEKVVEVAADIVIPADGVELDYWIDLT